MLFLRCDSAHIKTCWKTHTHTPALHSENTHHLLRACCPFTGAQLHYKPISPLPPNKQFDCELISPMMDCRRPFSIRPALFWHTEPEDWSSCLPLMFHQSCFITGRSDRQLIHVSVVILLKRESHQPVKVCFYSTEPQTTLGGSG